MKADEMVREHVYVNAGSLIHPMLQMGMEDVMYHWGLDEDEYFKLIECRDYESAVREWLDNDVNVNEVCEDDTSIDARREAIIEEIDGDWRDFAEEWGIDPYMCEVYEHWLVSDWLAYKLQCQGKNIVDFGCGCLVWCRCATGQAISMDCVIQKVAEEMK